MKENKCKNVVYFAENALSSIQGGGIVAYAVLKGLPSEKLLGFYDYPNITPAPEYAERFILLGRWDLLHNVYLRQHPLNEVLKKVSKALAFIAQVGFFSLNSFLLLLFFTFLSKKDLKTVLGYIQKHNFKPEIVYFSGLSLRYLKMAVDISKHFNIPMVLLHMDNWMGKERYFMGKHIGKIWYSLIKKYMKIAASRSLASTTNSPGLADIVTTITGYKHEPANNCCSDLLNSFVSPIDIVKSNPVPVITYAGAMNMDLQGETLFILSYAIAELNAEGTKVHLHIYTPWEFAPMANSIQIPNAVFYKGQISRKELTEVYLKSDFLLATTTFHPEKLILFRYSLATKLSEYLCVGKPVISIGHPDWHLHEYVKRNGCGFSIYDKEVALIKVKLKEILSIPAKDIDKIGENNRILWGKSHNVRIMSRETRNAIGLDAYPD